MSRISTAPSMQYTTALAAGGCDGIANKIGIARAKNKMAMVWRSVVVEAGMVKVVVVKVSGQVGVGFRTVLLMLTMI